MSTSSRPQSGFNDNVSRYASVLAYRTRNIVSCYSLLLYKNQKCNCVSGYVVDMYLGRSGNVCHCVIGMQARYWNGGGGRPRYVVEMTRRRRRWKVETCNAVLNLSVLHPHLVKITYFLDEPIDGIFPYYFFSSIWVK